MESVTIDAEVIGDPMISTSWRADMVLIAGLPTDCHSFHDYALRRERDNTIQITATNVRPADEGRDCTQEYRTETIRIDVALLFDLCETDTVVVNGEPFTLQAAPSGLKCPAEGSSDWVLLAPVKDVAIEVESAGTVQADLMVRPELINGCFSIGSPQVSRAGGTFRAWVLSVLDRSRPCTRDIRRPAVGIPLPGPIELCKTYTFHINGWTRSLQATAREARC